MFCGDLRFTWKRLGPIDYKVRAKDDKRPWVLTKYGVNLAVINLTYSGLTLKLIPFQGYQEKVYSLNTNGNPLDLKYWQRYGIKIVRDLIENRKDSVYKETFKALGWDLLLKDRL